jgi:hypothetical protein
MIICLLILFNCYDFERKLEIRRSENPFGEDCYLDLIDGDVRLGYWK